MKKVNDENDDRELPEEVMERLNKHCERTGDKIEDVVKHYTDFISVKSGGKKTKTF